MVVESVLEVLFSTATACIRFAKTRMGPGVKEEEGVMMEVM